jgi:hypothetical protein
METSYRPALEMIPVPVAVEGNSRNATGVTILIPVGRQVFPYPYPGPRNPAHSQQRR